MIICKEIMSVIITNNSLSCKGSNLLIYYFLSYFLFSNMSKIWTLKYIKQFSFVQYEKVLPPGKKKNVISFVYAV